MPADGGHEDAGDRARGVDAARRPRSPASASALVSMSPLDRRCPSRRDACVRRATTRCRSLTHGSCPPGRRRPRRRCRRRAASPAAARSAALEIAGDARAATRSRRGVAADRPWRVVHACRRRSRPSIASWRRPTRRSLVSTWPRAGCTTPEPVRARAIRRRRAPRRCAGATLAAMAAIASSTGPRARGALGDARRRRRGRSAPAAPSTPTVTSAPTAPARQRREPSARRRRGAGLARWAPASRAECRQLARVDARPGPADAERTGGGSSARSSPGRRRRRRGPRRRGSSRGLGAPSSRRECTDGTSRRTRPRAEARPAEAFRTMAPCSVPSPPDGARLDRARPTPICRSIGSRPRGRRRPDRGAVVAFLGVVRDHAEGRDGVAALTYEAYEEPARRRAGRDRRRRCAAAWPELDAGRAAAPRRRARALGDRRSPSSSRPAPRRGVRSGAVLHRHAEGDRADLEAGALDGRLRLGASSSIRSVRCRVAAAGAERSSGSSCSFALVAQRRSASSIVLLRNRRPNAMEHSIDEFERGLRALAPEHRRAAAPSGRAEGAARCLRDLAIDLGTANTLVYARGQRHHPQRADRHRAQQPHPRRARDGARGVADDRPHARLHRRGPAAARRRDHRLRDHAAHDPAAVPARGRQPPVPRAGADLRAVGDHARRAARGARSRAPRRCGADLPHRAADGRRDRRRRCRSTSRWATWSSTSAVAPPRSR